MNKHGLLLLLLITIIAYSCGKRHEGKLIYQFYDTDFSVRKTIIGQVFKLDSLNFSTDIFIIPQRKLLLVIDLKSKDFVKVYDLTSLRFIKSFILKGAGETQQLTVYNFQYDRKSDILYVSDNYKKTIFCYRVNDILSSNNISLPLTKKKIKSNFFNSPILSNNKILDIAQNGKGQSYNFDIFDSTGNFLKKKGYLPFVFSKDTIANNYAFNRNISLSVNGKFIVSSYCNTDYIDLCNSEGELIRRVQGPDIFNPKVVIGKMYGGLMATPAVGAQRAFVGKAFMDNDKILTLYDGNEVSDAYHVNTLLEFNSKLSPHIMFTLNKPIFAMAFDSTTNTIYGLTHLIKGFNIIKYRINEK